MLLGGPMVANGQIALTPTSQAVLDKLRHVRGLPHRRYRTYR
jgi:hypothetical protein